MSVNQLIARAQVPKEQTWNLESIFPGVADWQTAIRDVEKQLPILAAWQGKMDRSPKELLRCFQESEAAERLAGKIQVYAMLASSVDAGDQEALGRMGQARSLAVRLDAALAFMEPELIAIGFEKLYQWCREESGLSSYQFYFEQLERKQTHVGSQEVEAVLALANEPLNASSQTHSALNNADLTFARAIDSDGIAIEIGQGNFDALITHPDREVRRTAWENYADGYLKLKNTFAAIQTGGFQKDVFLMRARGFQSSLESSLFPNNLPVTVFHNLIDTFRTNLPTWHRYWELRRRYLGYDTFHIYDAKAPLHLKPPVIPYRQAVDWICEGMRPLGEEYVSILRRGATDERWVDWAVNKGKRQGAFSSGVYDTTPFIMMSYNDNVFSMSTLAHELGHSLHSYYSRKHQPYVYGRYSLFVAEVASNFNQAMVRDYLLRTQTDAAFQLALIEEAMSNFHRYFFIMPTLARWELEMHERIESGQPMNAAIMNKRCADLFHEGFGDDVVYDAERMGITWAQFLHMYMNFYVYQYATGISGAHALVERVLDKGTDAVHHYLQFLSAGGSLYPIDALNTAGVDLTSRVPVEKAFQTMGELVDRFESLL
ncbi:MAG: oligoendopeptidase F [Chloroflexi bacterium HGW-Chloroflexi-10]|nr:MAG: oligoendopeptidase F [Chloroflexi bacterium HGW-Chloroflexi-10]